MKQIVARQGTEGSYSQIQNRYLFIFLLIYSSLPVNGMENQTKLVECPFFSPASLLQIIMCEVNGSPESALISMGTVQ